MSPSAPPRSGTPTELDELAGQLTLGVLRLNRLLRQNDRGGLTPSLSAALASVARLGTPTLGELAASEHISPATMTPIMKKLETRRLVARVADPHDGRITRVRLTAAGRRQLEDNRNRRTRWIRDQLTELDPAERARLADAVDVLTELSQRAAGEPA